MANVDHKWIAPAVIVAAFAASAIAYTRLPSIVTLQMSAVLPFAVPERGEPGPRWLAAFLIPSDDGGADHWFDAGAFHGCGGERDAEAAAQLGCGHARDARPDRS